MMFFIGAPLGAIIRKEAWTTHHFFSPHIHYVSLHKTLLEKNSTKKTMSPFMGADVFFFFDSIGHLLTYRQRNDIGLINMDVILTQSK
jgi:hypothetical protein